MSIFLPSDRVPACASSGRGVGSRRVGLGGVGCGSLSGLAVRGVVTGLLLVVFVVMGAGTVNGRGHEATVPPSFGEPGSGSGQLSDPSGVAVNEVKDRVYVVDKGNDRVEYFNGTTHAFEGEINGSGLVAGEEKPAGSDGRTGEVETGRFSAPEGIAVDNTCRLKKLSAGECAKADPSNEDVYVIDQGHHVIDKYSSTGRYLDQITAQTVQAEFFFTGSLHGVSVDSTGKLWLAEEAFREGAHEIGVDHFSNTAVNEFQGFTRTGGRLGFQEPGFAVDSEDNLYFDLFESSVVSVVEFGSGGLAVNESLDRPVLSGLAVELVSDDVWVVERGAVARFGPDGGLIERVGYAGQNGSGIAVDSVTQDVFVTDAVDGVVYVIGPEPPGPVQIQAGSGAVTDVTAESASVSVGIDPRSEPQEEATRYTFEYGPCVTPTTCSVSAYGSEVTGTLAANYEVDTVPVHLHGLAAGTTYHVRVSAENSHPGLAVSEELVFTTQAAAGGGGLLDRRGWELVSPANKHGAGLLEIAETGVIQASASGDALTYLATAPTETTPQGSSNDIQVLAQRAAGGGWSSSDLSLPHESASGASIGQGQEYRMFSPDLSVALVQPIGGFDSALSPEALEQTAYIRMPKIPCPPIPCYTPLVSGCPEITLPCPAPVEQHANVPAGTKIDGEKTCPPALFCGPLVVGASPDLAHVILESEVALVEGYKGGLYEWAGGVLEPVSVLPGAGGSVPVSSFPSLGYENKIVRGAVSGDGSRVVWSEGGGGRHLYVRDMVLGKTVRLDVPEKGVVVEGQANPRFQLASADGSRVFFTDSQRLTSDAGAVNDKPDLYECVIVVEGEEPVCELRDLTPLAGAGESADVQGLVPGGSEDGSRVYFVADSVLSTNKDSTGEEAVHGSCVGLSSAPGAECDLYEEDEGHISLVAVLSSEDSPDWGESGSEIAKLTARASGDGSWLVFMSQRSLTGYDNHDAVSGVPDEEVYLYHAGGEGAAGGVVCVSCNPTGARPHGVKYRNNGLAFGNRVWEESTWLAAQVPGWTPYRLDAAFYDSRYLSGSGRVFFDSSDGLVAGDRNGTEDVYEFEPVGVGSCSGSSPGFSSVSGGCLGLVSSGGSSEESAFVDASESGDDVFFLTSARLAPGDVDTALDIYDARVGGGPPAAPLVAECVGDECQDPGVAPEGVSPGSLTFSGPGNAPAPAVAPVKPKPKPGPLSRAQKLARALKACAKRPRKDRAGCVRKARKAFGPARKASRARRAGER